MSIRILLGMNRKILVANVQRTVLTLNGNGGQIKDAMYAPVVAQFNKGGNIG